MVDKKNSMGTKPSPTDSFLLYRIYSAFAGRSITRIDPSLIS